MSSTVRAVKWNAYMTFFILCGAPLKMAFLNARTAGPMKVCLTLSSHKPVTKWLVFSLSSCAAHLCSSHVVTICYHIYFWVCISPCSSDPIP